MKRIILAVLFIASSLMSLSSSACSSFSRRWGANSFIANVPLFFKPYQYEERGCGCACSTSNPKYSMKNKEVRQTRPVTIQKTSTTARPATIVAQTPSKSKTRTIAHSTTTAQNNTIPGYLKKMRKSDTSTAIASSEADSIRKRQEKLQMKRNKIQQQLAELEHQQSSFNVAKV